jgi:hypothetical protein
MPPAGKASRFSAPVPPTSPLRPPFAGTRRDLWLPIPLKRCDLGLETGRDLAKIGSSPPGEGLPYEDWPL